MIDYRKIDLHMHTVVSDGTDTPDELLENVRRAGITLFSVTDHDALKGCSRILAVRRPDDPAFITGVEFSCSDEEGKYHILGYGYDPASKLLLQLMETGHIRRMYKAQARLDFLADTFGFKFPEEEQRALFRLDNPGKPHVANLMVKYGYAKTKEEAMQSYLNRFHMENEYIRPEEAITGILEGGGIPVLAHPSYGSGSELITGDSMDERLKKLIGYGLEGVEAYYSGFSEKLRDEVLSFAEKYGLYVTAGSDYHGKNKTVALGDTGLAGVAEPAEGLLRFLDAVRVQAG